MLIEVIPCLQDNYSYLVICPDTKECAIIDTPEVTPILTRVDQQECKPTHILNTHHHWDHAGGNAEILSKYPDLKVVAGNSDGSKIDGITGSVDDGDTISIGRLSASVVHIPAHTLGHVAFLFDNALFCGDTLFIGGCGRLFEGDAQQMYHSLSKLADLPGNTRVYCGHEYTVNNLEFALTIEPDNPNIQKKLDQAKTLRDQGLPTVPSTIGEEQTYNPFLRCDLDAFQNAIWKHESFSDPIKTLAKVRELKDRY